MRRYFCWVVLVLCLGRAWGTIVEEAFGTWGGRRRLWRCGAQWSSTSWHQPALWNVSLELLSIVEGRWWPKAIWKILTSWVGTFGGCVQSRHSEYARHDDADSTREQIILRYGRFGRLTKSQERRRTWVISSGWAGVSSCIPMAWVSRGLWHPQESRSQHLHTKISSCWDMYLEGLCSTLVGSECIGKLKQASLRFHMPWRSPAKSSTATGRASGRKGEDREAKWRL